MLIILLLFARENDGGINCDSEDIYERVQSNFHAVMARAVNFKRPKGVCLHALAARQTTNTRPERERPFLAVNISVAQRIGKKDKIIQKGIMSTHRLLAAPSYEMQLARVQPPTETGPSNIKERFAYRCAPSASARMIN